MDSSDLQHVERRTRIKYEWSRARRALIGFAPALGVVALAIRFGRPLPALVFGALMFAGGVLLLWYGRELKKAVLPGLVAGVIPLTLIVCAKQVGHVCSGDHCMMLCVPACIVGGLVAGLAVAAVGHRVRRGPGYWLSASAIALLTGAMGCACVGYSGVVGLGLGYLLGLVPALARALFAREVE